MSRPRLVLLLAVVGCIASAPNAIPAQSRVDPSAIAEATPPLPQLRTTSSSKGRLEAPEQLRLPQPPRIKWYWKALALSAIFLLVLAAKFK